MSMGFGIIGCGDIAASSFAPSLMKSQRADLVAVCRRDGDKARAFADKFGGCSSYDSAEGLLADPQVEAVVVATPTDGHLDYTLQAAARGKHVLCEKPMGRDRDECRRMIEACREAGVKLGVAYRRRLFPQVLKAKEIIAAGDIGRVVCVRTHYSGQMALEAGAWRADPVIGGALMEMAVHRIEVLLNFAGWPTAVSALVETVEYDVPTDDSNALLLSFADGKIGVHSTILTSPPRRDTAQIDGTKGRIIIDSLEFSSDQLRLETDAGTQVVAVEPLPKPYFDLPMIDDFVEAVHEDREPVCDGITGYWTQAVADGARASASGGKQVEIEAF